MPALAVAGKPRFLGCRRSTIRPRSASPCNASTSAGLRRGILDDDAACICRQRGQHAPDAGERPVAAAVDRDDDIDPRRTRPRAWRPIARRRCRPVQRSCADRPRRRLCGCRQGTTVAPTLTHPRRCAAPPADPAGCHRGSCRWCPAPRAARSTNKGPPPGYPGGVGGQAGWRAEPRVPDRWRRCAEWSLWRPGWSARARSPGRRGTRPSPSGRHRQP